MKTIYHRFLQLFTSSAKSDVVSSDGRSFFDYSSSEKIKILRAAGRQAQREQQQLLKAYEDRFGPTAA